MFYLDGQAVILFSTLSFFWDTLILQILLFIVQINIFWVDLTDVSAVIKTLMTGCCTNIRVSGSVRAFGSYT